MPHAEEHNAAIIAIALVFVAAISALVILGGLRPVRATVRDDLLVVSAGGHQTSVSLDAITQVSLQRTPPRVGRKLSGFNFGGTLRGSFRCADGDSTVRCQVFARMDAPPFLVIRTPDRLLILNLAETGATHALYRRLRDAPSD